MQYFIEGYLQADMLRKGTFKFHSSQTINFFLEHIVKKFNNFEQPSKKYFLVPFRKVE